MVHKHRCCLQEGHEQILLPQETWTYGGVLCSFRKKTVFFQINWSNLFYIYSFIYCQFSSCFVLWFPVNVVQNDRIKLEFKIKSLSMLSSYICEDYIFSCKGLNWFSIAWYCSPTHQWLIFFLLLNFIWDLHPVYTVLVVYSLYTKRLIFALLFLYSSFANCTSCFFLWPWSATFKNMHNRNFSHLKHVSANEYLSNSQDQGDPRSRGTVSSLQRPMNVNLLP